MSGSKGIFSELAPALQRARVVPTASSSQHEGLSFPEVDHSRPRAKGWGVGWLAGKPWSLGHRPLVRFAFSDGSKLAAVDIDRDDYVRVAQALLRSPPCGRIGAKGIAYLVRLLGDGKYRALKVKGKGGAKVGEILCDSRLLVLPPTIHPDTKQPYRWIGRALLDVDYRELPLIEA
jgi:Bifunctional DNA primase/polymerase, N-terminal